MKRRALITGITGQDGAYLAELLLDKGYEVHGIKRRASSFNTERIDHLYHELDEAVPKVQLHYGDMTDSMSLLRVIQQVRPHEIYNLAAQSHVAVSFEEPEYTANADGLGALRVLEAMRVLGLGKSCRFYQASTSELYGAVRETPQTGRGELVRERAELGESVADHVRREVPAQAAAEQTSPTFVALNLFPRRMTPSKGNRHRCSVGLLRRVGSSRLDRVDRRSLQVLKSPTGSRLKPRLPEFMKMQRGLQAARSHESAR